ncbi:MAG TPA: 3-carboxy-cis,cis-muconate cycloisomerase [Ktedonobacterales bacterium]
MSDAAGADALFTTPQMAAIWSAEALVARMLAFEAALAHAEAAAGIIPHAAADSIAAACRPDLYDAAEVWREAAASATPAIPLVRMLTARVPSEARGYVHWGATSQDTLDTALVLQMRAGLDLLVARLLAVGDLLAALATRHRDTPMAGRTLMQQAVPITFGLKAARWLALVTRQAQRLHEMRARVAVVELGGAAGTLAALGADGPRVTELLAAELGLAVPDLPWHAERDRVAEVAAGLGVTAGAMAKIAGDLVLLAQSEVGEASPGDVGKGGSSAMPQKRNPTDAAMARAAARLAIGIVPVVLGAMDGEHERAAGAWQAEWAALPALFGYTAGAVERVHAALAGLRVDAARMGANLDASHGQIMAEALTMALAPHIGRDAAYSLVRDLTAHATAEGTHLRDAALADERIRAALSPDAIARAFDPTAYLGSTGIFIDRALAAFTARRTSLDAPDMAAGETEHG